MLGSLVQQAMDAQAAAAAPLEDGTRDWESEPDGADAGDTGGPVNEKPVNRRDLMLMSTEDLMNRTKKLEEAKEKKFGANKKTIDTLRMMSSNALDFITRCAEWEAGKTGIRNQKKEFEKALEEDPFPSTPAMDTAWRHKPDGCNSLKAAVLHRLKGVLDAHKDAKQCGDDVTAAIQWEEAQQLRKAVQIMNERFLNGTKAERVVKDCYGFCKQQEAGEKLRAEQRRRGAELSKEEVYRKWPCLAPGWTPSAERDAKRDAMRNGEAPIGRRANLATAAALVDEDMPRNEGMPRNAQEDFIAEQFGMAAAAAYGRDNRFAASPPRAPVRAYADPQLVQEYANGKRAAEAPGGPASKKQKPSADNSDSDDEFL